MKVIEVAGATGNYDTDFQGKAKACLKGLLGGLDFVYVHMEAPDECGHHGDLERKIYSIEQIDGVVKTVCEGLKAAGEDFRVLIAPDHPTPISIKTHSADPIPYIIYDSTKTVKSGAERYDEVNATKTGVFLENGFELMERLTLKN